MTSLVTASQSATGALQAAQPATNSWRCNLSSFPISSPCCRPRVGPTPWSRRVPPRPRRKASRTTRPSRRAPAISRKRHHVQRQLRRGDAGTVGNLPRRRDRRPDRGRHHGSCGDNRRHSAPIAETLRPSSRQHPTTSRPSCAVAARSVPRMPKIRIASRSGRRTPAILRQAGAASAATNAPGAAAPGHPF